MSSPDDSELRPSSHPTRPPSVSTAPPTRARPDVAPDAVPARVARSGAGRALDVRSAFLLLHVDGREDLASIGELTALPFEEVRRVFASLVADGLVTLSAGEPTPSHAREPHTTSPPPP